MSHATPDVSERIAFAAGAAREAGRRILRHYGESAHETKPGGSPVTAADLEANEYLVGAIRAAWPGEPVLAEESKDPAGRRLADGIWIVDPLDGTREFLAGNGEFAVMIGFAEAGEALVGVVYLPARGLLYEAGAGHGSWQASDDGSRRRLAVRQADAGSLRMVGSRSHPDALVERMQSALSIRDVKPSGSVGVKCGLIAEGDRDLYIHPVPYLKEWDTCAPEVVLREAGGVVTDCLGERLRYNKVEPSQPHGIVACGAGIHDEVMRRLRPLYEAERGVRTAAVPNSRENG